MIHYSCDRCDKTINVNEEIRYVVRIEVQLAMGYRGNEQLNEASIEELEKMLEEIEPPNEEFDQPNTERESEKTFDLCSCCYSEYINNPLAIETVGIGFSKN